MKGGSSGENNKRSVKKNATNRYYEATVFCFATLFLSMVGAEAGVYVVPMAVETIT